MTGFYNLGTLLRELMEKMVSCLNDLGLGVVMPSLTMPVLPDHMVQRADPCGIDDRTRSIVEYNYPSWLSSQARYPYRLDPNGINANDLMRQMMAYPDVLREDGCIDPELAEEINNGVRQAVLFDVYVEARLQYNQLPSVTTEQILGGALGELLRALTRR